MTRTLMMLALLSTSFFAFAGTEHKDCCKPGKAPCCSEACCKPSDDCCKGTEHKACKSDCKAHSAPKK